VTFFQDITPNYYGNVRNAFASADALKTAMEEFTGPKWFLAHSLGNMLVSAAIQDCGMPYEKYFMLNAAVPMEAYDVTADAVEMVDSAWSNVPVNYRASDWNTLFTNDDFRASLSWRGRFAGIQNAVNCFSATEDVLENPALHGIGGAWSKQELFKGTTVWNALNALSLGNLDVACEGGWGINTYYALNPTVYVAAYGFMSNAVTELTRDDIITHRCLRHLGLRQATCTPRISLRLPMKLTGRICAPNSLAMRFPRQVSHQGEM